MYKGADIAEGAMGVLDGVFDICLKRANAVHLDPLRTQVEGHAEAAEGGCDLS